LFFALSSTYEEKQFSQTFLFVQQAQKLCIFLVLKSNLYLTKKKGLDTDFHNIEVPFPSVTVCPDIAYNEEVLNQTAFNFLDEGSSEGIDQIIGFLKSLPIMSYDRMEQVFDALQNVSNPDKFNDRDLRALIFEIGIKCNDLFSMCYFKGEEVACCDYFYPLYNEQGFCYAFNPRYHSSIEQE
jgi:acid-sensing ion channel, other